MSLYSDDKEMLRQIIVTHYDKPNNKIDEQVLPGYKEFHNKSASCIDDLKVYVLIEKDIIKDAKFSGISCAISTASTDILCELIKNQTIAQVEKIFNAYHQMITNQEYDEELLGELIAFQNIHQQQNRIKCALIGITALEAILKDSK